MRMKNKIRITSYNVCYTKLLRSVDANIIIAERIGEEIKKGMTIKSAIKKGYENSFSALFDGNLTTAIVV